MLTTREVFMAKNLVEKRLRERLKRKKSKKKIVIDIDKVLPDIKK